MEEDISKHKLKEMRRLEREKEKISGLNNVNKKKRNKKVFYYFIVIVAVLLLGFWIKSIYSVSEDAPIIKVIPESYNFGEVSMALGKVSSSMKIVNEGLSELRIKDVVTSCMCTSAYIKTEEGNSPRFGMHSGPSGWEANLMPGETAELVVEYDPNVHPDLRGPVTRVVSISSNDPRETVKKINIFLNQVG